MPDGDPDATSARLYEWHHAIWSHQAAQSRRFRLVNMGLELRLTAKAGVEVRLKSDGIITTWTGWTRLAPDVAAVAAEPMDPFFRIASTIGAYILWPVDGYGSINQIRGSTAAIADRFDLTLECIRRHYLGEDSPLSSVMAEHSAFFDLFVDFGGYADFWLVSDALTPDGRVRSFMTGRPIDGFRDHGHAQTAAEYFAFRESSIAFVSSRNDRIRQLPL